MKSSYSCTTIAILSLLGDSIIASSSALPSTPLPQHEMIDENGRDLKDTDDRFSSLLGAAGGWFSPTEEEEDNNTDDRFSTLMGTPITGDTEDIIDKDLSCDSYDKKKSCQRANADCVWNVWDGTCSLAPTEPDDTTPNPTPNPTSPTADSPTNEGPYWYPQRTVCTGSNSFSCHTCIYGEDYPNYMTVDGANEYLFDRYDECCAVHLCDEDGDGVSDFDTATAVTDVPTGQPSDKPTTSSPSKRPTNAPVTPNPTAKPSPEPTTPSPSKRPTNAPFTPNPTAEPSPAPTTKVPSPSPSKRPTPNPSLLPITQTPTPKDPSSSPSLKPTYRKEYWYPQRIVCPNTNIFACYTCVFGNDYPTWMAEAVAGSTDEYFFDSFDECYELHGTDVPTSRPTLQPSLVPSDSPSKKPTKAPTLDPTISPTTQQPTESPSAGPTLTPAYWYPQRSLCPFTNSFSCHTCVYGNAYPEWMIIDGIDNYLFDSYEKCCEKHVCDGDETASPSNSPTKTPTPAPSESPSAAPTPKPTSDPSASPSATPSISPTPNPTNVPTTRAPITPNPTLQTCPPVYDPLNQAYVAGSEVEVDKVVYKCNDFPYDIHCTNANFGPKSDDSRSTDIWTNMGECEHASPTLSPLLNPSTQPTEMPSMGPTVSPSMNPTVSSSHSPSINPSISQQPSNSSSTFITLSSQSSMPPTVTASSRPSIQPSISSSALPSSEPSASPITRKPTSKPSNMPSKLPTNKPSTEKPSLSPTSAVSNEDRQNSPAEQQICSCAPRSFTIQIDPSNMTPWSVCDFDTINLNGGISNTQCSWTNVEGAGGEEDTPVNIKTRFVGFVEMDEDYKILSRSVRESDVEGGNTFTFRSISASLDTSLPLEDQMKYVPYAAGLLLVGENANGEELNGSYVWHYSHNCDAEKGATLVEEDMFGVSKWITVEEQDSEFCPASPLVCPPAYDELAAATYVEGSEVEMDGISYRCNPFPFAIYCTMPNMKPKSTDANWKNVWSEIGACQVTAAITAPVTTTSSPTTAKPSRQPSEKPTTKEPSARPTQKPVTSSPSRRPTNAPVTPNPTAEPSPAPTTKEPSPSPSKRPTPRPTSKPVEPWCPSAYDESIVSTYKEGTEVEVGGISYKCNGHPYAIYCTHTSHQPKSSQGTRWDETWEEIGPCRLRPEIDSLPLKPVTPKPTPKPTLKPVTPKPVEAQMVLIGPDAGAFITTSSPPTKNPSSSPTTSEPSTSPTTAKPSTNRPTSAKSYKSNNTSKSSKTQSACDSSKSSKAFKGQGGGTTVTAPIEIELDGVIKELDDTAINVFEETCQYYLDKYGTNAGPCISDVTCNITSQMVDMDGGLADGLILEVKVVVQASNTSEIDLYTNTDLFESQLKKAGEEAGIDDFEKLSDITVTGSSGITALDLELANPPSNGAEKQSNKAAVLWSMFVLAALGALVAALIVHRKSRRRQRKRRQWGEVSDHGLHSDNGDLEEQHSEEVYDQCMDRYEAGEEPTHNYPSPRTERGLSTPRTQAPPTPLSTVTEMRSRRELNQAQANQTMMSPPTYISAPEEANLQGIILRDRNNNGIPSRFVKRDIMAPSGKLGIVIKRSLMGCMIHSVKEGSPMEGHLYDGDIIILFNDEDVTGCTARQLTMMIAETSDVTKKFTVLSNTGPVRF